MLKKLDFPPNTQSIDLSQNKLTTLEGVRFPEGLEHLNLSHNQITTLERVTLPSTIITLNLSYNPNLTLKGVDDFLQLGWGKHRPYRGPRHPMNQLVLTKTKVTLTPDLCYMKNIPSNFKVKLDEGVFTDSRDGNAIKEAFKEACHKIISKSEPGSFMQSNGGKKRQQTRRQQAKRQQAKRHQAKRQQKTRRQSKLKK
jgi:hypothetical protein